ncbi:unnamed protein product [Amaranthus hypochondriacus]
MMDHECTEDNEFTQNQHHHLRKGEEKAKGEKRLWIPAAIAKVMKDVSNVEDLRAKLVAGITHEGDQGDFENNPPNTPENQAHKNISGQEEDEEEGWTPGAPGKAAHRLQKRVHNSSLHPADLDLTRNEMGEQRVLKSAATTDHNKDGNPLIPLTQ